MEIVTREVNRSQLDSNVAFIIRVYIFLMKFHENQTKVPSDMYTSKVATICNLVYM